jgi:hypothetical protein
MIRYLISLFILLGSSLSAQDFNYTVSAATETWQELNSQTILNANNSAWNFSYKIPVGFSFHYLGSDFDSVRIETNGYLVFDTDRNYSITAFAGFEDAIDEAGNHSVLGYELSGNSGTRILKIQFLNTCNIQSEAKFFSYQVWLKETGEVEFHVGPNDYQYSFQVNTIQLDSSTVINDTTFINDDSSLVYRLGLINMNMDTETRGLFIGGNLMQPESQPVNDGHPDPVYFFHAPAQNARYTFTPNF